MSCGLPVLPVALPQSKLLTKGRVRPFLSAEQLRFQNIELLDQRRRVGGGGGNPQRSEHSSPSSPRRDCTECQHQLSVALTLPPSSHIPAYLLLLRLLLQRCSRCARRRKAKQTGALCRLPLSPPQKTTVGRGEGLEARV